MTVGVVKISTLPRASRCHAETKITDGVNFRCTFSYPERVTQPRNLSEELAAQQGNDWAHTLIYAGAAEFGYSEYQNETHGWLDGIEAYVNPARWRKEALPAPPLEAPDVFCHFDIKVEKKDHVRVSDQSVFVWEPNAKRVRVTFADDRDHANWLALADTVHALVSPKGTLVAIQFEGVIFA